MTDKDIEPLTHEEMNETEGETDVDRHGNALIWISSISSFVSWAFLVVIVAVVGISAYAAISSGGMSLSLGGFYTILNWLVLLFVGVSIFLILQAVSRGIFLLMDIHECVTEAEEKA